MTDSTPHGALPADSQTPFADLDAYIAMPRVAGLALAPDGNRLITSVATLNHDRTEYVTALWEIDPVGDRPVRRLTRSTKGESGAAFLPDGSVLFCSARPDPDAKDDDDVPLLWMLPVGGGEARVVAKRAGGIGAVRTSKAGVVALTANTMPSSLDDDSDRAQRKERKDKKVSAILHDRYPVRYWDHDLGPGSERLLAGALVGTDVEPLLQLRDLAPDAQTALRLADFDVSPDGTTIVTQWNLPEPGGVRRGLALIDVATGHRSVVAGGVEYEHNAPVFSPDGARVAFDLERRSIPTDPGDHTLTILDVATGEIRELTGDWDRWPAGRAQWTPDGTALIVPADENGRAPIFRIDVDSGQVTRLTADDFAYSDVQVSPDGATVYALRSSYLEPPRPVRLSATEPNQQSTPLPSPSLVPNLPGRLAEIEAAGADGTRIRGWLAVPEGASALEPAPLMLWIHGGPLSSWNAWSWRWNPWLAVARGYAVLLPDPALSTGYGLDFIRRGWGAWGNAPYTDLLAITDAAVARPDIAADRTAALGGSFGGYMANWIAGHTQRFRCIVSHAGLWALDQFAGTTDATWYWKREMTADMTRENSPHRHITSINTPMLLVHGDKDYRVPIGEALRMWSELVAHSASEEGEVPHKFLYFPDENHWILSPQHVKVWYETVLGFVDHHVQGKPWRVPDLLH